MGPESHVAVPEGRLVQGDPSRKCVPAWACPNGHSVLTKVARSSRIGGCLGAELAGSGWRELLP